MQQDAMIRQGAMAYQDVTRYQDAMRYQDVMRYQDAINRVPTVWNCCAGRWFCIRIRPGRCYSSVSVRRCAVGYGDIRGVTWFCCVIQKRITLRRLSRASGWLYATSMLSS